MTLTNPARLRFLLAASLVTAGAMAGAHAAAVPDPSTGGELNTLRVDDVTLVQSTDVDVIGR